MSISISQVEKVLRKAGIEYSNTHGFIVLLHDTYSSTFIETKKEYLRFVVHYSIGTIKHKFNQLTVTDGNLEFSWRGQEPLKVKIK